MSDKVVKTVAWRQKTGPFFCLPTVSFSPKEDVDLDVMAWSVTLSLWDRNLTILVKESGEKHGNITEEDVISMSRYISRQAQIPQNMAEQEIKSILLDPTYRWMVAVISDGGIFNTYAMEVLQSCIKDRMDKKNVSENDDWMKNLSS